MSKKSEKELTAARERYNFFTQDNHDGVEVWAKLLDDDDSNTEPNYKSYSFAIYTDAMLDYMHPFYIHKNFEGYVPVTYTFTATVAAESVQQGIVYKFLTSKNYGKYVRCLLKRKDLIPQKDRNHMDGLAIIGAPLSFSERTKNILSRIEEAALTVLPEKDISAVAENSKSKLIDINQSTNSIIKDNNNGTTRLEKIYSKCEDPEKKQIDVRIYKVGNANSLVIKHYNGKSIMFDCGYQTRYVTPADLAIYQSTINHIKRTIKPSIIIISHWHDDHFNAIANFIHPNLDCIIVYDIDKCPDQQVKDLITAHNYIDLCQFRSIDKFALEKCSYDGIRIFKATQSVPNKNLGYGIIPFKSKKVDDDGLMLCVGSLSPDHERIILPGDASYYCWPSDAELLLDNNLKYLLLPHHGGAVYTRAQFNNTCDTPQIYVSRGSSYVPVNDPPKTPTYDNEPVSYIENGMNKSSADFKYTSRDIPNSDSKHYLRIKIDTI